jgi:hypothetical protein
MMPGAGRFMQADRWGGSAWSPWKSHPFIYVNNNPMVFVDPYGLWSMSLRGVLNYTVGTFDGIGQSLLSIGTSMADNMGQTAAILGAAASVAAVAPNLVVIGSAGLAGLALKESITHFYEKAIKGKDISRAFGKILVDSAFFYLTAKNVPKAVANLKNTFSSLKAYASNLKNTLRNGGSVGNVSNALNRVIKTSMKQLKKKIKHASDFGVEPNFNHANGLKYKAAISEHVANADKVISGTYRWNLKGTHFFNTKTKLWVFKDSLGNYHTGWKLSANQINDLFTKRNIF